LTVTTYFFGRDNEVGLLACCCPVAALHCHLQALTLVIIVDLYCCQLAQFWDDMQRSGIQPRRFFLYTGLAAGVALGGNLFGVTSGVLGLAPVKAGQLKLDIIYPIKGYKRCVNEGEQR
jgi:hypothetical protein